MIHPVENLQAQIDQLKQKLLQREAELAIINSVQQGLVAHRDVQSIYDLVGDKIREIFDAQVVMLSTYDQHSHTVEHRYAIERGQRVFSPGPHPPGGFRAEIIQTRQPILINSGVAEKAARLGQPTLPGTVTPKSWLGVPLFIGEQVTGILSLQSIDEENAFGESHVRLLQTLAASMSLALENARLWEQEQLYRRALESEFEIGRRIQAGFLPNSLPQPEGWEIAAQLQPAREVAGDFYDVFELPDERIGLVIADVCDKGLGAALFMTLFRSLMRAVANLDFYAREVPDEGNASAVRLRQAFSLTNNYMVETHGETGMFATIFFGILDIRTGRLTYINGGHLPPILLSAPGRRQLLSPTGPAVGVRADTVYSVRELLLERGDLLFACTDGLTDAVNPAGKTFGEQGWEPALPDGQDLKTFLGKIQTQIDDFAAGARQHDDITMLAVRYCPLSQ